MSIRRNTIYNLLGAVIPLALSLVTIPIYLELIGQERYGVLAIVWLLLGYFGLFDLGLGRATAQRIAKLREGTDDERAQAFWTALTLNLGLGVVGGLLIWPVANLFLGSMFKVEDALRPELQSAVFWLILAVPMATLSGVLGGALQGREKFLELNLISISGTMLFQLLPLASAVLWDVDLGVLLPSALFARLLTLLLLYERCKQQVIKGQPFTFSKQLAGQLLRFGGWVTVTSFISPIMVILDRFLIGALLGAKAVSYYTIPFQLAERSSMIPTALAFAIFPRFASVSAEEEQRLAEQGARTLVVVMTPLAAGGIFFMYPFLAWWITPEFADHAGLVGQVILLGFWMNSFARIPFVQLQARGRPDLVAKCHLAEVLPYLGLLYLGYAGFGLAGIAAAFSLRVIADFLLLAGLAGTLSTLLRLLVTPSLLMLVTFLIAMQIKIGGTEWFAAAMLHLLLIGVWAWRLAPVQLKTTILSGLTFFKQRMTRV